MSGIRADIEAAIKPIHGGKYIAADFEMLAKGIDAQLTNIVTHCRPPAETDAQFHLVVANSAARR